MSRQLLENPFTSFQGKPIEVRGDVLGMIVAALNLANAGASKRDYSPIEHMIKARTGSRPEDLKPTQFFPADISFEIERVLRDKVGLKSVGGAMFQAGVSVYPRLLFPALKAAGLYRDGQFGGDPIQAIKFEFEGFLACHRNVPARIMETPTKGRVKVYAPSPHPRDFMEGVFKGVIAEALGTSIGIDTYFRDPKEPHDFVLSWPVK